MEWTGSMPCNVAITRCLLDKEIKCLHSSSSPAWLRGRTYEPGGTWSDRPVSHHLWVTNCCRPKILDEIFLRQKVHIPQQLEGTSRTPGGSEALTFIMRFTPPRFSFKTSSLDYCLQRYFWQHSRVLGCGCLGHRGLLKIGARVSENFSCVTKFSYANCNSSFEICWCNNHC